VFSSVFDSNFTASTCHWRLNYGTWVLILIPYPTFTKADRQLLFHAVLSDVFSSLLARNSFHVSMYRILLKITPLILISALHNTTKTRVTEVIPSVQKCIRYRSISGWKLKLQINISIPVQVFFSVICKCTLTVRWYGSPPLWSSCQSSWLQIQGSGFDSRRNQIFLKVVGLKRGPFSLVSTTEELLGRKSSGSGLESRE
jgi:hypothetical protein